MLQAFYAACQGLLYVLCYRMESLLGATAVHTPHVTRQRSMVEHSMQGAGSPAQATRSMFLQLVVPLLHHRSAILTSPQTHPSPPPPPPAGLLFPSYFKICPGQQSNTDRKVKAGA